MCVDHKEGARRESNLGIAQCWWTRTVGVKDGDAHTTAKESAPSPPRVRCSLRWSTSTGLWVIDQRPPDTHYATRAFLGPSRAANLQAEGRALGALVGLLGWKGTQAEGTPHLDDESHDVGEVRYG